MTMSAAEIVEGMRDVQARLHQLMVAAQSLQGVPVEHPGRKYTEEDRARWREMAGKPDLAVHSTRRAAKLIARREGLPPGAFETIRRSI